VLSGFGMLTSRLVFLGLMEQSIPVCYHKDRHLCSTCVPKDDFNDDADDELFDLEKLD